jgi:hypothetical protein
MPCLVAGVAFFFPRVAIILLVIFSDYIGEAFGGGLILPLLGFLFLPYTTLVYAWTINSHGSVDGLYIVALIIAILADLGSIGGGGYARTTHRRVAVKRSD